MSCNFFNKSLIICILFLFFGVATAPEFGAVSKGFDEEIIVSIESDEISDDILINYYIFDKKGNNQQEVILSSDDYERFYSMFEELNHHFTYFPFSSETEVLKVEFVDLLASLDMIPNDSSKEDVISLLNSPLDNHKPLFSLLPNPISNGRGSAFFCNFLTWGEGSQFPVIILPRLIPILLIPIPRVIMRWNAINGITSCGGLLSGKGFIAEGAQKGTALGFWGIGFSVFLPPVMSFGFIGYALFATATAENIIPWPPNRPPVVSGENPPDGTIDVPLDISELSFSLSDLDGDRMNYTVTTSPYIGGGSGNNVLDGSYSVDIFGLESDTEYSWRIIVSDGEDTTEESFNFRTEIEAPLISEPLPVNGDDWVPADLSELSFRLEDLQGDPMDFTVETVPFIGGGSGSGVGNGIYSIPVSGLEYTRDYTWFVNVTDGKFWTRKIFRFKTQPIMVFDPFDEGWYYYKQIIINHSKVAGDFVDFPVLISLTDVDLRDKAQSDGDDVLFMDGEGVANRLFHENEFFDGSSGELVAWVNAPSLSSGMDTVFYLYYGNSGCGSQEYPDRVWDSDFIHVWHLGESLCDSAGFYDGNDHGTSVVSGKIGVARDFESDELDFIDFGDMDQPGDGSLTTMTWEAWVKPEKKDIVLMTKYDTSGKDYVSYHFDIRQDGKFKIWAASGWGVTTQGITDNSYSVVDEWLYLAATFNLGGVNDLNAFIDGYKVAFTHEKKSANVMNDIPVTDELGRGRYESGTGYTDGVFDEIRWSKVVRSDEWINTSFNTMNDPTSFFSIGPEESGS